MKPSNLHIIIIDDNPSIHNDFIKVLTRTQDDRKDDELLRLGKEIFGEDEVVADQSPLPKFVIDTAVQGQEGVEKVKSAIKEGRPYALAFVDVRMPPGWDGIETIKNIWKIDPNIQIVICTAYSDYSWEETVAELGQTDNLLILKKPFDNMAVRQLACALTKKWKLMHESHHRMLYLENKIKERTTSLEKSLSLTRATLESSADGILVVSNSNKIADLNSKLIDMWKIPKLVSEVNDYDILTEYMMNQIKSPKEYLSRIEELNRFPDKIDIQEIHLKDERIIECYSQPQKLNNKSIGRIWSYRDITKRVHMERKLIHQSLHDTLTGLPNRIAIMEEVYQSISTADEHKIMAVYFLDLDRFKLINDSLGHEAGDELIKQFSQRLVSLYGPGIHSARLGGDEFLIFATGMADKFEVEKFAERLLKCVTEPYLIRNRSLTMTTSIGISLYPQDGKTADELLRHADAAMYFAKELGSNHFQFYNESLNSQALARLEKEAELRAAIDKHEFVLYYQPQFDVISGKLTGVEALIRWNHPKNGFTLPMDFIPLAEETGLIVPIGEWVLRTACQQNKFWQAQGLPPIKVAVNVAAQQFKLPHFVSLVASILNETQLDPAHLEIEVTENTIVTEPLIVATIHELKKLGVTIMLDDFGTGYSSLTYLKRVPLDGLKIDRSFIENIAINRDDEVIIRAIITMAHSLNLDVVAEGVDSTNQLSFLKTHHCKDIQGYYFSQPVSGEEIIKLLKKEPETVV